MHPFGTELRRRRDEKGLPLRVVAKALGCSIPKLSRIETGKSRPKHELVLEADKYFQANGALVGLAQADTGCPRSPAIPWGLPDRPRHFVGRHRERADAVSTLLERRPETVAVGGIAGAGKTGLAVVAARDVLHTYPDGCLMLDFQGYTVGSPGLTEAEGLERLLRVVAPGAAIPPDRDGRIILLRTVLAGRRMLFVFDNVRSASQIRSLLPAEPKCGVVITSRTRLNALDEARHIDLGALQEDEAADLFRMVSDHYAVPDPTVQDIVASCGYLPLAVRIVAARYHAGGVTSEELRAQLSSETSRFTALEDEERSVAGALSLSCTRLRSAEKRLLAQLAVHPGGRVEVAFAAAMAGLDRLRTIFLLDRLHQAYLVERRSATDVELHDLVRALFSGHESFRLDEADRSAALCRLLDYVVPVTGVADALIEPGRFQPGVPRCEETEFADSGQALEWFHKRWPALASLCELADEVGRPQDCWRLAHLLRAFFSREKLIEPWIRTHQRALAAAEREREMRVVAMIENNLGMAYQERGDLPEAARSHGRAAELFAGLGDEYGETDSRASLAWVQLYRGEPVEALAGLGKAGEAYRRTGRSRNEIITLRGMALAATSLNRAFEALEYAQRAYGLASSPREVLLAVNCLGWVCYCAAIHGDARAWYDKAADLAQDENELAELARALVGLGNVAAEQGELAVAGQRWAAADQLPVQLNSVIVGELVARRRLSS
ncbi:helix-turn-helix domain-containing protein [Amycolatopsis sp. NPDC059090]|uniref:helix-turn-helix domain-containing protein n=1 Tax=unclassified Amycolatopsis TaxID=2618356 RepID=UPI00367226B2